MFRKSAPAPVPVTLNVCHQLLIFVWSPGPLLQPLLITARCSPHFSHLCVFVCVSLPRTSNTTISQGRRPLLPFSGSLCTSYKVAILARFTVRVGVNIQSHRACAQPCELAGRRNANTTGSCLRSSLLWQGNGNHSSK